MDQLLKRLQEEQKDQNEHEIEFKIEIRNYLDNRIGEYNVKKFSILIDSKISFKIFIQGLYDNVLQWKMENLINKQIQCKLKDGDYIAENEERSLQDLGFKQNCTFDFRYL